MAQLLHPVPSDAWLKDNQAWSAGKSLLYVIQEGESGPLKVGVAGHPVRRLASLQCGNHRKLHLRAVFRGACLGDAAAVEKQALESFKSHRLLGEWMNVPASTLLAFLRLFAEDV